MIRILFIIFLLFGSATYTSEAQTARKDSLERRLPIVEDPDKIPILIDLVKLNQQNRPSAALAYATRAEELLKIIPAPPIIRLISILAFPQEIVHRQEHIELKP